MRYARNEPNYLNHLNDHDHPNALNQTDELNKHHLAIYVYIFYIYIQRSYIFNQKYFSEKLKQ